MSDDLIPLIQAAMTGSAAPLERYLIENSNLPGPRMNLALVNRFADAIGQLLTPPNEPSERLEQLVDGWAARSLDAAPVNNPREMLPCCGVMTYGQAAVSRPEWWDDEIAKLHQAASNPRWRVREIVAMALQRMLKADWTRAIGLLNEWAKEDSPLVIRAAVAGVAEPPLLTDTSRGEDALAIQVEAVKWLMAQPSARRREEDMKTLRKALGFTVSVAVAATPESGFRQLEAFARLDDADVRWIVRENLKKNRLSKWPERVAAVQKALKG
jgi:hypothetical protein